jgi:hypothetical protein
MDIKRFDWSVYRQGRNANFVLILVECQSDPSHIHNYYRKQYTIAGLDWRSGTIITDNCGACLFILSADGNLF